MIINGTIVPFRAAFFSAECSCGHALAALRSAHGYGEVGSHASSQRWLRSRTSLHRRASRNRGGRSDTGPADNSAGQPGWLLICSTGEAGITVQRAPATTSVTSSSITTRQLAEAIDAIRCEPGPPTNDTL